MQMPRPPAEVAWLCDVIGAELTLRLVEQCGGTSIYIPAEVNQGSRLTQLVGLAAARALSAAYSERAGAYRVVPLLREWRVRVEAARGLSDRAIAQKLVLTEAHVSRLRRAARRRPREAAQAPAAASPQMEMFGASGQRPD